VRTRLNIDTPMLAGDDRGRLWFAALHPLTDLVEEVTKARPRGAFMDFLYNTPFTEVYTDQGSRAQGRHPGCCVVDLFTYALSGPTEHRIVSTKVAHTISAEWGLMEAGAHYASRMQTWRSRTPESFIPEDIPDIRLIRFRMDEEGHSLGAEGSWGVHAARLLNFVLGTLYMCALSPQVRSFSFPIHTAIGDITDEGSVPYREVARYFYELPRRHFSGAFGDLISGGYAEGHDPREFNPRELHRGIRVELEHTNDPRIAQEIAMDHLVEDPHYYTKLMKAGL
jgi:hypothetical protein